MVRQGKIEVHSKTDAEHPKKSMVHLSSAESLHADVLVCATGWRKESSIRFSSFGTAGIGLPDSRPKEGELSTQDDEKILTLYP